MVNRRDVVPSCSRRRSRAIRWLGLGAALPVLWSCNARTVEAPEIRPTETSGNGYQETLNRKIDILFMVDNSKSMDQSQANLAANLPAFMDVLKKLPDGLPDLHIAVVSSDMGAGDGSFTACSGNGDAGVFHFAPTGGCTATNLEQGATFISAPIGGTPNFTGDITAAFQCIAQLGAMGCGFEHQLASVARALGADGSEPPQENQGFIRKEAYLAIVLITNEDDCSAPMTFFDNDLTLGSAHGAAFRCNEFGHLCSRNGGPPAAPIRLSPNPDDLTTTVSYDNCVSSEEKGQLTPVAKFIEQIRSLKDDPNNQILVASIQGLNTPYVEHWIAPPEADTGPWPEIEHSCDGGPAIGFADPGVRLQQFVEGFGGNGLVYPICSDDFGPSLKTIAEKLSVLLGPSCFTGKVANRPGTDRADCTVTQSSPGESGKTVEAVIAACADNGNTPPCWSLASAAGTTCPANSQLIQINRGGQMAPANTRNSVQCSMCIAGVSDASRGCP
jgi:hypothetical protein